MQESAEPAERETELFFQLSSADRRRILSELQTKDLHLSEVSKALDMTATETLRQLQRMVEASFLEKLPDGSYRLTSYASLVLESASPLDFISRFREYFLERDASLLPRELRARLGELSGGTLIPTTMDTLNKVTSVLNGAQSKIDGTVEVGFQLHQEIMSQRLAEGIKVRWLVQESYLDTAKSMLHSEAHRPEIRWIPQLFGHVYVTDKAAAFCLRRTDGSTDYSAFYGEDPGFLGWANDLFAAVWEKAKPWYP